jgi:hypothetical protein
MYSTVEGTGSCTRASAAPWAPTTSDRRPAHRRGARLPAAHPRLRRRPGAAVINGYGEWAAFPWPLIQAAGQARDRRRRHPGLRLPAHEPDRRRAGEHGAQPRPRQPGHLLGVQAGLAMQAIACSAPRGKAALAAHGDPGAAGRVRAHRADPRVGSVASATSARRDGDTWVLNGATRWIGNGTWPTWSWCGPRRPRQAGQGVLVEKGTPGRTPGAWRPRARRARWGRPRSP